MLAPAGLGQVSTSQAARRVLVARTSPAVLSAKVIAVEGVSHAGKTFTRHFIRIGRIKRGRNLDSGFVVYIHSFCI